MGSKPWRRPVGSMKKTTNLPAKRCILQVDTLKWKAVFRTRPCANCGRKATTSASTSAATAVTKLLRWKRMTASACMLARANRARTEWRQDTDQNDEARMTKDEGMPKFPMAKVQLSGFVISH